MIQQTLKRLGFGEKEIKIYLAVLQAGSVTPAQVARLTKINRTTVYAVAKDLVAQGIINEDAGTSTRRLLALPPTDLMKIAREEETVLASKKKLIYEAIGELESITQQTGYSVPKTVFIGEDELESYMSKQAPVWNASAQKFGGEWWGFQERTLTESYAQWFEWYWRQPSSSLVTMRLVTNQVSVLQEMSKQHSLRREVRLWPGGGATTPTLWTMGEYVVVVSARQHPHYLVEINDPVLALSLRETYKGIWLGISALQAQQKGK